VSPSNCSANVEVEQDACRQRNRRMLFDKLGRHGRLLVVVDQPATIGALPVTVARACGVQVAYLPGLA
jgi:hypothetical protein